MRFVVPYILLFFFVSCCKEPINIASKCIDFKKSADDKSVIRDTSSPGHYFQRLDSINKFGFNFNYRLKDQDTNSQIFVIYKGKIRSNFIYSEGSIVSILSQDGKTIHWRPNNLRNMIIDLNVWNYFYDSIILPPSTKEYHYNSITIQGQIGDSKNEIFDLDSICINLKALRK